MNINTNVYAKHPHQNTDYTEANHCQQNKKYKMLLLQKQLILY